MNFWPNSALCGGRGWWVEPTPRDMYHCLEECVATLDTAKNRLKSFASGGITLVEEEEV